MPLDEQLATHYSGGFIAEPMKDTDWILGALVERPILLANGDWGPYRPTPNVQFTLKFDPFSCVSESIVNALEEILNLMMERDPSVRLILEQLRCLDANGKAKLSARFLAAMSGTIPGSGNTQGRVFDTLRRVGICGEALCPTLPNMSQAEYFTITEEMKKAALEFYKYFNKVEYEAVSNNVVPTVEQLKEAHTKGPVVSCVGGAYLGKFAGASLYRNSGTPNYIHQINNLRQRWNVPDYDQTIRVINDVFDTYEPFNKPFYEKYPFGYAKIVYLTKKKIPMLYKKIGQSAICCKHWSENSLIAFADGILPGGDVFKSLYGITNYSELIIQNVPEWPFPIKYHFTSTGLVSGLEDDGSVTPCNQ